MGCTSGQTGSHRAAPYPAQGTVPLAVTSWATSALTATFQSLPYTRLGTQLTPVDVAGEPPPSGRLGQLRGVRGPGTPGGPRRASALCLRSPGLPGTPSHLRLLGRRRGRSCRRQWEGRGQWKGRDIHPSSANRPAALRPVPLLHQSAEAECLSWPSQGARLQVVPGCSGEEPHPSPEVPITAPVYTCGMRVILRQRAVPTRRARAMRVMEATRRP